MGSGDFLCLNDHGTLLLSSPVTGSVDLVQLDRVTTVKFDWTQSTEVDQFGYHEDPSLPGHLQSMTTTLNSTVPRYKLQLYHFVWV